MTRARSTPAGTAIARPVRGRSAALSAVRSSTIAVDILAETGTARAVVRDAEATAEIHVLEAEPAPAVRDSGAATTAAAPRSGSST